MSKYNKTDHPLKSVDALNKELRWSDYEFKDEFTYACTVHGDADEERLDVVEQNVELMEESCVYIIVINGSIFKIGVALRGVKKRIGSYNSGRTRYRIAGTNSSANYWCLQSFIKMAAPVRFYVHHPRTMEAEAFGEIVQEPFPSAKTIEGVVIRKFEETYGRKPIGNTQG